MVHLVRKGILLKPLHTIPIHHTLHQKLALIILLEHMQKHMDFHILYLIAQIIMGQINSQKNFYLLFINNIINKPLPVYGDGNYTRDWLYVKDHACAIDILFHSNIIGETFNIGGFNEWKNIDLVIKAL